MHAQSTFNEMPKQNIIIIYYHLFKNNLHNFKLPYITSSRHHILYHSKALINGIVYV